jgi:hypothetical protein
MLRQIKQCAVAFSGLATRALALASLAGEIDRAGLVVQPQLPPRGGIVEIAIAKHQNVCF